MRPANGHGFISISPLLPISSDSIRDPTNSDVCGAYKNFSEDANYLNKQIDFSYKTRPQDPFMPELYHEGLEFELSERKLLSVRYGARNLDEYPLECQIPYRRSLFDSGIRNSVWRKRSFDDFSPFLLEPGLLPNQSECFSAMNHNTECEMEVKQCVDQSYGEDIGNKVSTAISLSGAPAYHQYSLENDSQIPLHHWNNGENYFQENRRSQVDSQNQSNINRDLDKNSIGNPLETLDTGDQDTANRARVTGSSQRIIDQSTFSILSKSKCVSESLGDQVQKQPKQRYTTSQYSEDSRLACLCLEDFNTGKGGCFPDYIKIPRQLQFLIENDPDEFLKSLSLPQEVYDLLKESKILNRLKFASGEKVGPLSREARKIKLMKYKEKRQHRTWNPKINYTSRKIVAEGRMRQKGRFVANRHSLIDMLSANSKQED